jgi:hypothetical protein
MNRANNDLPLKKPRSDGQISALAGEFLTAGMLLKHGLQASITIGNAKAVDILAFNPETLRSFTVEVKTTRAPTFWLLRHDKVQRDRIYVFVTLGKLQESPRFYVVPGKNLADDPTAFGKWFTHQSWAAGIYPTAVTAYENRWEVFKEPAAGAPDPESEQTTLVEPRRGALMGRRYKYAGLQDYLAARTEPTLTLSMEEIERLIGAELPPSAYDYREWWSNQPGAGRPVQAKAWMTTPYRVDSVHPDRDSGWVRFARRIPVLPTVEK